MRRTRTQKVEISYEVCDGCAALDIETEVPCGFFPLGMSSGSPVDRRLNGWSQLLVVRAGVVHARVYCPDCTAGLMPGDRT